MKWQTCMPKSSMRFRKCKLRSSATCRNCVPKFAVDLSILAPGSWYFKNLRQITMPFFQDCASSPGAVSHPSKPILLQLPPSGSLPYRPHRPLQPSAIFCPLRLFLHSADSRFTAPLHLLIPISPLWDHRHWFRITPWLKVCPSVLIITISAKWKLVLGPIPHASSSQSSVASKPSSQAPSRASSVGGGSRGGSHTHTWCHLRWANCLCRSHIMYCCTSWIQCVSLTFPPCKSVLLWCDPSVQDRCALLFCIQVRSTNSRQDKPLSCVLIWDSSLLGTFAQYALLWSFPSRDTYWDSTSSGYILCPTWDILLFSSQAQITLSRPESECIAMICIYLPCIFSEYIIAIHPDPQSKTYLNLGWAIPSQEVFQLGTQVKNMSQVGINNVSHLWPNVNDIYILRLGKTWDGLQTYVAVYPELRLV